MGKDIIYTENETNAILFIHGILGTPRHFKSFVPLVPEEWTAVSLTLEGHCGEVKDLSHASMSRWKTQVHETVMNLRKNHSHVFVAAHSMGTLFAIQEAVGGTVDGLFLLNAPLSLRITKRLLRSCCRAYTGSFDTGDVWDMAAKDAYGIAPDKNLFHYAGWIPRYIELFREIGKTVNLLGNLKTPCYVYLSAKDEMVSPKTASIFNERSKVRLTMLNESGHFYYSPEDLALMLSDFKKFVHPGEIAQ